MHHTTFALAFILATGLITPVANCASAATTPPPVAIAQQQTKSYSGNTSTRIYHNSGCRYFSCKKCTASFASAEEARTNGFKACKVCGG